jgi:hypothetical protein
VSLRVERRPLTDEERKAALALADRERPRPASIVGTSLFLILAAVFLAPCFAGSAIMILDGLGLRLDLVASLRIFATAAVLVLAWEGWSVYETVAEKQRIVSAIEHDLGEGVAEVLHVEAASAVKTFNGLSRGPAFLIDLGDGDAFFLQGAHLEPHVTKKRFPCRRFSLIRLPTARLPLELIPEGEPLEPARTPREVDARDGDVVKLP